MFRLQALLQMLITDLEKKTHGGISSHGADPRESAQLKAQEMIDTIVAINLAELCEPSRQADFLKFTEYLELVQEIKRFKSRPGNSAVDIYLYWEEFMNSTMRSWVLTRLHLYYGSERAKRAKEYKSVTSSEMTNLESVQFLPMLEKVFISTNKEEYQRFFKRIIEQFKPSMACKTLTMASVRYLIADFEVFTEIFTDAITVNPEKEKPDDTELGPWHPGLKDSKALDQQGMLPIIMSS